MIRQFGCSYQLSWLCKALCRQNQLVPLLGNMAACACQSIKETQVTFAGPEGYSVASILCEPADSNSSKPFTADQCAILCHGFGSHKNGFHFPAIAQHLAEQLGLSSLRLDYTGNMDSPGPFRFGGFMKEVQQMLYAKHYLERAHGKKVALLLGHSRGAINATLYTGQHAQQQQLTQSQACQQSSQAQQQEQQLAADNSSSDSSPGRHDVIPLVVLIAGRYDLTLNMQQRYGPNVLQELRASGPWDQVCRRDGDRREIHWTLTAEELEERFALDMPAVCAAISSMQPPEARPKVLVVHGAADPICEASDAANLAGHISGAQLVEIAGADHWFKDRREQLLQAIEGFVRTAGKQAGIC